jgi:hypothetical protein
VTPLLLAIAAGAVVILIVSASLLLRMHKDRQPMTARPAHVLTVGPPNLLPEHACVSGLTLIEAEDLLDWLELHGYQERSLQYDGSKWFAVEFRIDSEHLFTQAPGMWNLIRVTKVEKVQVPHGS